MKKTFLLKLLPLFVFSLLASSSVHAEKEDSNKPINIEADQSRLDNQKNVTTMSGNVIVSQGTLIMKADTMTLKKDAEGNQFATLHAAPGSFATFRQKSDGGDFWIEGQSERIEYNSKIELVQLYSKAKLRRLEGTKIIETVDGEYISYDSRTEFFAVNNTPTSESKPGAGRIKIVIQPRTETKSK